ncbi:response regulator transcription factor [Paenibacillus daejeonensis]|uniref:response regulator transcription factor n=1 Tax=Paenibacillus daejeonensis TaxID=135193 RepID=UPI00037A310F|nr:response regulator [Paenibacillus daejeonensis]
MIRVVLADDEPIIIKGLRKLIDWSAFGMEIVGCAYDGAELMEHIETLKPDIVISDISMPHRSGIDIIREVKERGLSVKVIFISAYQEFTYAKDAIAYGAIDYLIKPVVKQQLEKSLHHAASLIDEDLQEEQRRGKLEHLERKHRHEELQAALGQLVDGVPLRNTEERLRLETLLPGPYLNVLLLEAEMDHSTERWGEKESRLIAFAIGNILEEMVTAANRGFVFQKNERHVLIVHHRTETSAGMLAEDIRKQISAILKLEATVAVSGAAAGINRLEEAYAQAEQMLHLKFFAGLGKVLRYTAQAPSGRTDKPLYELRWTALGDLTSTGWPELEAALNGWLQELGHETWGHPQLAISACLSSIVTMIQELAKSGLTLPEETLDKRTLQQRLATSRTFEELGQEFKAMFRAVHEAIHTDGSHRENLVLARIKQHIEEHYAEEITLESMASQAYMNPYYFSTFFKKHTGHNFKSYVTGVRMKHALLLLSRTDLKVYEIAERVGYNNARHFSDMFKKLYGQLPNDYRQEIRK